MKYICAQPAVKYFAWQIEVLIYSLTNNGVDQKDIHIVNGMKDLQIDSYFSVVQQKYPNVVFEFYKDDRDYWMYQPSIKPHLMHKHYIKYPELQNETIFFVDSDIALTKPIDFNPMLNDDVWYLSNTNSYLNYDYIISKGRDVLNIMLQTANISEYVIKNNNNNSGGAQYLLKNVDTMFWKEVQNLSERLYINLNEYYSTQPPAKNGDHHLQVWTSEMWAMIWTAWKKGKMTLLHPNLDFCWATDNIEEWDKKSIYHDAGVTCGCQNLFKKHTYSTKIPDLNLNIDNSKCSFNYYNIIKKALTYK